MPKFRIVVMESVTVTYRPIVIEAANEEAATDEAERMRCDGELNNGTSTEAVEDVDFDVTALKDATP